MLFNAFAVALILLVVLLAYARKATLFSPLILTCLGWLLAFMVGLFVADDYFPITPEVQVAWVAWFLILSLMLLPASGGINVQRIRAQKTIRSLSFNYSPILVGLILWLAYRAWIIGTTGSGNFILNLRLGSNGIDGFTSLGAVARFYPLVFALFLFEHCYARRENRTRRQLLWAWMLLYALATMSKFGLLTPILAALTIRSFDVELRWRTFAVIGVSLFGGMVLLQVIRASSGGNSTLEVILNFVSVYAYSPIVALGYASEQVPAFGAHIFRFFYAVSHALGGGIAPIDLIKGFVMVPHATNVFTAIGNFYFDFGAIGVVIGAISYGAIYGGLFIAARRGSILCLAIYASIVSLLAMQFFVGLLFMSLSGELQILLFLLLIFFISSEPRHARRYIDGDLQRRPIHQKSDPLLANADAHGLALADPR